MGRGKDGFDALMGTRRGEGPATVTRRAAEREAEIDRLASLQVGTSENISIRPGGPIARMLAEHEYERLHPEGA
jgi:hypothetical protein